MENEKMNPHQYAAKVLSGMKGKSYSYILEMAKNIIDRIGMECIIPKDH